MINVVLEYFHMTDRLLVEIKRQDKTIYDFKSEETARLQIIIGQLSQPSAQAEKVRVAYIKLSAYIESELRHLHAQGLYPDPYCGAASKFELMEKIDRAHRDVLMTEGGAVPAFTLNGTSQAWRDKGLLDFAIDQQIYLQSIRFSHLWDAVQCYEMQRYLIAQLFKYLNLTGKLG